MCASIHLFSYWVVQFLLKDPRSALEFEGQSSPLPTLLLMLKLQVYNAYWEGWLNETEICGLVVNYQDSALDVVQIQLL